MFDAVRINCLNGDEYKTGKITPDGTPDPSIFPTEGDPVGIQVGSAVATLVHKAEHTPASEISFRNLWGQSKRTELLETAEVLYDDIALVSPRPAVRAYGSERGLVRPVGPARSVLGVKTGRAGFLVDTDLDRLKAQVGDHFDPALSHEEIARRYPGVTNSTAWFDTCKGRDMPLTSGGPDESGFIRIAYRAARQPLALLGVRKQKVIS